MSEPEKPKKIVPQGQTTKVPDKSTPEGQLSDEDIDRTAGGSAISTNETLGIWNKTTQS
jgi:hypothetical protein